MIDESKVQIESLDEVVILESVDSTNSYARQQLGDLFPPNRKRWGELSLISTDDQRSGRGRLDRVWSAPAGTCLCSSFIIRPHANPKNQLPQESFHWFTLLVSLAAVQVWKSWGIDAVIKWPNDVMVGGKKVCGVLAQLVVEPNGRFSAVVGIGMNLNLTASDLPVDTATSALVETGREFDMEQALTELGDTVARYYRAFSAVGGDASAPMLGGLSLLDMVRNNMATLGQQVTVHLPGDDKVVGLAVDIDDDGAVVVRESDGTERAWAVGDVVHMRPIV